MSYHDQFEDADVLSTLSWIDMPDCHRIMKLAALFLKRENDIKYQHRNWEGPTLSNVRPFVKSYYVPPRGKGKSTVEMVLKAISYQRGIAKQRRQNPQVVPLSLEDRNSDNGLLARRNAVAARHYTSWSTDYNDKLSREDHRCVAIGSVGGVLMMVDKGGSYGRQTAYPRVYMRQKETGKVKVVVLTPKSTSPRPSSIVDVMMLLAPKAAVHSLFGGDTLTIDFDEECFKWQGRVHPWRGVHKIYDGKDLAHKTRNKPKQIK